MQYGDTSTKYPQPTRGTAALTASANADLVKQLSADIARVLEPLLPAGTSTALIDFPNYANVGDSAIWLGQREFLARHGNPVVYSCDRGTYSRLRLQSKIKKDSVILLQGGGNFGDIYPWHQHIRQTVVTDFPDHRIIVLPQTIHFRDRDNLLRAKKIFDAHNGLTILVRDRYSLDFARNEFAAPSLLCPDMAFALGDLTRQAPPDDKVLCLLRKDPESCGLPMPPADSMPESLDWMTESALFTDLHAVFTGQNEAIRPWWQQFYFLKDQTYNFYARQRLLRGCRMLSRGQVVITDRLHGHILSLLLRIPHVVLDNNYGKVSSFYNTWTQHSNLAHWAESVPEALKLANSLAG